MRHQILTLNEERNVTLECFLQDVGGNLSHIARRPAIVILPGGGYFYCSQREADSVASAYLHAGFQAFVLRYSVAQYRTWPNPLEDFDQAMALIRENADSWHIYPDKIAVIGFSAGGHLACAAATMSKNRPNAAILAYPAAGSDIRNCNETAPDTVAHVDRNTCPCFLFATRNDELVSVNNTLAFQQALADANISFESHIYAYGPHGVSVCNSAVQAPGDPICSRVPNWVADSVAWLKDVLGDFGAGAMTDPRCPRYVSRDWDETLSVGCTVETLMQHPEAAAMLRPLVEEYSRKAGADPEIMLASARKLTLRAILGFARIPQPVIDGMDQKLRQIPNRNAQ